MDFAEVIKFERPLAFSPLAPCHGVAGVVVAGGIAVTYQVGKGEGWHSAVTYQTLLVCLHLATPHPTPLCPSELQRCW